jgi:colanic acid/amylovoran biosynthesis glycosyltransferase
VIKPVVASYVSDFLKPDMLHVYRQITGLQRLDPWVLTHRRECADRFPFPAKRLVVLPKPRLRWWRRFVHKHISRTPWQIYRWELRRMLMEMSRAEARLLHVYFGHIAIHLLPLIKACPHPVIVSYHGADAGVDSEKAAYLFAMREVFQAATLIQCRSQSLANDLQALGCPSHKIEVQRTGVPLEEWPFEERRPPGSGEWRLLQSCRLIEKKGLDITLRALKEILRTKPRTELVIAGDGPLRSALESLASELGVAKNVRFTGFLRQEELRKEVYRSHIFIHPSRTSPDGNREGIPNSLLEAMASGAPVISTRHGGIPEAITNGESGMLVDENDHHSLAIAAHSLMAQPGRMVEIAEAARRSVEAKFNRKENSAQLEDCYLRLIED